MPRPHALRSKSVDEIAQLGFVNCHLIESRLRPEFHSHLRSLENIIAEFQGRIQDLTQEMDEGLQPQGSGGWTGRVREGWPKVPTR